MSDVDIYFRFPDRATAIQAAQSIAPDFVDSNEPAWRLGTVVFMPVKIVVLPAQWDTTTDEPTLIADEVTASGFWVCLAVQDKAPDSLKKALTNHPARVIDLPGEPSPRFAGR